jgi:peroxiredoxin
MEDIIKVGETAPDFTLKDQNGEDVSLSDFVGKKVCFPGIRWHGHPSAQTRCATWKETSDALKKKTSLF